MKKNNLTQQNQSGNKSFDTIIIGAGQAGLTTSYFLKQKKNNHIILEQNRIGSRWYSRWDSFTLVTPNALNNLPDFPGDGKPERFLSRDEVIQYLESFAGSFEPPLQLEITVTSVEQEPLNGQYVVYTSKGNYICKNVIIATGTFQEPYIPSCANGLPSEIHQIHSSEYRNPSQLPDGAVLVVGSGQSGTQIADELHEAGRKVYLSVSGAVRLPRRYRGKDIMEWLKITGTFERTVDQLESPNERFAPHPHISGKGGGKTINLRKFGRNGIKLTGKITEINNRKISFADDLHLNLKKADDFAAQLCQNIDQIIEKDGLQSLPREEDTDKETLNWNPEPVYELNMDESNIKTIIWATGYRRDYSWVKADVFDTSGYPVQNKGVTSYPGLYFVGMHWLNKQKSGLLYGVAEDARFIADHIDNSNL